MVLDPKMSEDMLSRCGADALRLPLDVYTTDDEIIVKASLPGLGPEDVEIIVEKGVLTIQGTLRGKREDVRYLLQERPYGCVFARALRLNVSVDVDAAEATFDDGVLKLVLPKMEKTRPKTIRVS
jgi:HSP20 family protein